MFIKPVKQTNKTMFIAERGKTAMGHNCVFKVLGADSCVYLLHLRHCIQMRFELKASLLNSELVVNIVDMSESFELICVLPQLKSAGIHAKQSKERFRK